MATQTQIERLRGSWVWIAILGAIALIGGILALANPFAATLAATLLAGWTFLLFGVVQIIQAFRITGWSGSPSTKDSSTSAFFCSGKFMPWSLPE